MDGFAEASISKIAFAFNTTCNWMDLNLANDMKPFLIRAVETRNLQIVQYVYGEFPNVEKSANDGNGH